jgi:molybdopterin adenylyltransferase
MAIQAAILTVGDRYLSGEAKDESGLALEGICNKMGWELVKHETVPDQDEPIIHWLVSNCDSGQIDIILTVDGIGIKAKDRVPESMYQVCERWLPGFTELARHNAYANTPLVALTRGLAGIRAKTLVLNLPGTPTAVKDSMDILKAVLRQTVDQIKTP